MAGTGPTALLVGIAVPAWARSEEVDAAWDQRLGPFVDAVLAGQGRAGLVVPGRLVESWKQRRPGALKRLREALEAERIELLATALHGPVLSAIPERDAAGQLAAHTTLLKRVLGVRPTGVWVPHGVWEPWLPRLFHKAGLTWTALPRDWLAEVGAPSARRLGVEREGRAVDVLSYVPAERGEVGLGVAWLAPDTPFEALLSKTRELPSRLVRGPRARAYLPAGGPGGLWERHLLADAGADALHKRMIAVSRRVRRLELAVEDSQYADTGPDPHQLQQARRYLFRAQATEAYTPVIRPELHGAYRDRAWRDLLRADRLLTAALGVGECSARALDLDCDGVSEARVRTASWTLSVAPEREGAVTELSSLPVALNVLSGAVPVAFRERWGGLEPVALTWELVSTETAEGAASVVLCADSRMNGVSVRLTKKLTVPERGAPVVVFEVQNRGMEGARGVLGTELFATLGGPRLDGHQDTALSVEVAGGKVPLDEPIELPDLDAVAVIGWRARLELELEPRARFFVEPLEGGSARVMLSWPVELWGRERERRQVKLRVREEVHG